MSNYVPLDEAAKKLGVSPEELVEMRSRGEIFGYRDGASWKFKPEEIERVQQERDGDFGDEAGGSSILLSDRDLGISGSKSGSTIGGDKSKKTPDSDLNISDDGSDVALVPDPNSGSGVKLVSRGASTPKEEDSDGDLHLLDSDDDLVLGDESGVSALSLDDASISGSQISLSDASGLDLSPAVSSDLHAGSEVKKGSTGGTGSGEGSGKGSDPISKIGSSGSLDLDGDLELAADDEDDLVLGSGSDLALAVESGINLMSPSDSGISLEDEPLDLAGTGISGLDLAGEGSDPAAGSSPSASASGSLVDFQQDEEFNLSPSGGIEVDEDSDSQVIELEDSTEFGAAPVGLGGDDPFGSAGADDLASLDDGSDMGDGLGMDSMGAGAAAAAGAMAMRGAPEVPFSMGMVAMLLIILLIFGLSGIIVTDIVRNMWQWNEGTSSITSSLTQMLIDTIGWK